MSPTTRTFQRELSPIHDVAESDVDDNQDDTRDDYGLPDFRTKFIDPDDLRQFDEALNAPEALSLTAINDWRPIHQRIRKSGNRRAKRRRRDETREGFVYALLKWPFLVTVLSWIAALSLAYLVIRCYILFYEYFVTWTGKREKFRKALRSTDNYKKWKKCAKSLDKYLDNDAWKEDDEYAYYDHATVGAVTAQLKRLRARIQSNINDGGEGIERESAIDEMRILLEGCVKNNFAGVENPRLYSETYFGTKALVQAFINEAHASLKLMLDSTEMSNDAKHAFFKHLYTNFGRTALCLSGGATFSYYHFGVVKALLDNGVLPDIISGTSGGALIAALVATRTDSELERLLVPSLAYKIRACHDSFPVWVKRWWKTGARFDSLDWAEQCSWFCRGSTTFREAYERTGRILNVTCVPSDPHSPTILANYLTSPNCVIWTTVIASAAVPGILNPVVLMMKKPDGTLAPYSFGHKWKDGSLRTDIPLKALDIHFNANFPIVSQVNPHISLFSFSSRGSVGRPVTHRKGRGWRGGFLGSAMEQFVKLDLNKWLKVLRRLELLPRPLGQDWSEVWLQRFSGIITIWPKSVLSDFYYILSDPSPQRLSRMLMEGQQSTFPTIKFIDNRMKLEKLIMEGLKRGPTPEAGASGSLDPSTWRGYVPVQPQTDRPFRAELIGKDTVDLLRDQPNESHNSEGKERTATDGRHVTTPSANVPERPLYRRRSSVMEELKRQTAVFFDDTDETGPSE